MVQPRAQWRGRYAEIGAQQVLTEKAVELHAHRVLEEGDAAHVSRGVPRIGALVGILFQLAKVGRQQLLVVPFHGEIHSIGDERRRVAEQVDVFVHLPHHFERQLTDQSAVRDEKNRNLLIALAHRAQDLQCGAFIELVISLKVPIQKNRTM